MFLQGRDLIALVFPEIGAADSATFLRSHRHLMDMYQTRVTSGTWLS